MDPEQERARARTLRAEHDRGVHNTRPHADCPDCQPPRPEAAPIRRSDADADLLRQIRRLQHAANMLNGPEFATANGWEWDEYSKAKWREFQAFGRLGNFSGGTLLDAIHAYERIYSDEG